MYIPGDFILKKPELILRYIREYPFALMVVHGEDGPEIVHTPMLAVAAGTGDFKLKGHVARANPINEQIVNGQIVNVIFHGPHCYVSPNYYESTDGHVPTWNYITVQIRGTIERKEDSQWYERFFQNLSAVFESGPNPWQPDFSNPRQAKLLDGVVGFEIHTLEIEAKAKLSQNRSDADFNSVIQALMNSPREMDRAIAKEMHALNRG